jgi:hypothetical protein
VMKGVRNGHRRETERRQARKAKVA